MAAPVSSSTAGPGATTPAVTGGPGYQFNTASLPTDVLDRYSKHEDGTILRRSDLVPILQAGNATSSMAWNACSLLTVLFRCRCYGQEGIPT